jgi:hypothetical protein
MRRLLSETAGSVLSLNTGLVRLPVKEFSTWISGFRVLMAADIKQTARQRHLRQSGDGIKKLFSIQAGLKPALQVNCLFDGFQTGELTF